MSYYLPFIVIGLTTGSVYAMAAVGLVLTYRTSRILNFAHGALATVTVVLFYALIGRGKIPWQVAAVVAVLIVGPGVGVLFQGLGRRLTALTTEAKVLATIGLVLFISGAEVLWSKYAFGPGLRKSPPSLPGHLVNIFGVNIGYDQMIIVAAGLVMAGVLHLILEHTDVGRSMRAVVDNPELLALSGRNPVSAQRAGWALGIAIVTLSGVLLSISPNYSVPVGSLDLLVLQAFGAAAIGGFRNLPLTYLGGLLIGVASALNTKFVASHPLLGGLPSALPFIVLFVVLVAVPRYMAPDSDGRGAPQRPRVIRVSRLWQIPVVAVIAAAILIVPLSHSVKLTYTANEGVGYAIIFLGLALLVRTSGLVSLCQMGLAAVGAAIFAHLAANFGVPWFAAALAGGLAAAAVGAVVAIPAIRVAGIYVAVATFGFGVLLEQFLFPTKFLFSNGDVTATRPVIGPINANDNTTFFFVALVMFGVATVLMTALKRARLGRLLRALGDSPVALEAQGTAVNVTKVTVFAISAFLAGIGGIIVIAQLNFLQPGPFDSTDSLTIVAVLLCIRAGDAVSALVAATAFVVVPAFLTGHGPIWWLDIGFGTLAVIAALTGSAPWLPRWRWAPAKRTFGFRSKSNRPVYTPALIPSGPRGQGLEVRDLTVHFKGTVALSDLTLEVPTGRITGLIGPNGAGKTTTFNFCSGLVRPVHGRLLLHGRDITSLAPSARARHGIGRTFQVVDLFESMTVRENVELGAEGAMAGASLLKQIGATPRQRQETRQMAVAAMELAGITDLADREARTLSTGQKRLVEISRCLAGNFDVLLLDEPSNGLDSIETSKLGELLIRIVEERGPGILLVEHNMSLVTQICSYIYVLDFGQLIFEGSPEETMSSDAVAAAYLGGEVERSH